MSTSPRKSEPSPPAESPGFEASLVQLESLIERIESGEIGLEQSIAEYERGIALISRCREILEKAEQRVEELNRKQPGNREQP